MLAKKCDICGSFYIPEDLSDGKQHIQVPTTMTFGYGYVLDARELTYDICPKCYLAVKNVLESRANMVKDRYDPA